MPVDVPNSSLDHLTRAPLKVAVAQVRFKPVHSVAKRELVADFQSRLASGYVAQDKVAAEPGIRIHFGTSPPPPPPGSEDIWPFLDQQRGYAVSLGTSSLAVEADAGYHDFDQFLGEFRTAVDAFADVFAPRTETRLGLRYVNELQDERLGHTPQLVVSGELLGPVGTVVKGSRLRSVSELHVDEALGTFVLRHGLSQEQSVYLLDLDYFAEQERDFQPGSIVETVEQFHELIERFFVWSLHPDFLGELR